MEPELALALAIALPIALTVGAVLLVWVKDKY